LSNMRAAPAHGVPWTERPHDRAGGCGNDYEDYSYRSQIEPRRPAALPSGRRAE
jgi:hypothetical protein